MAKDIQTRTSTSTDDWCTPRDLIALLEKHFGPFTFDAAANPSTSICSDFTDDIEDTLSRPDSVLASDLVWCNPPYKNQAPFIRLLDRVREVGARMIMLVPARPDTRRWRDSYWKHTVVFLGIRPRFWLPDTHPLKFKDKGDGCQFPVALVCVNIPIAQVTRLTAKDNPDRLEGHVVVGEYDKE